MDSLLQPLVRDRPDEPARCTHCPHQADACGYHGVGRLRRPQQPLCRLDDGIAKDIVRQLRRAQLYPVHDRIRVAPEADRIDERQAAHAPRVRRRQLARYHAAERVPDDDRFFNLQIRRGRRRQRDCRWRSRRPKWCSLLPARPEIAGIAAQPPATGGSHSIRRRVPRSPQRVRRGGGRSPHNPAGTGRHARSTGLGPLQDAIHEVGEMPRRIEENSASPGGQVATVVV